MPKKKTKQTKQKIKFVTNKCTECGGKTFLIGIELHATKRDIEVLTFECENCHAYTTSETTAGKYLGPEPREKLRAAR